MVVGIKHSVKLIGISIVACCAVFVCTLFLNYNLDLAGIKEQITTEPGLTMYQAVTLSGKVVCTVTGGCLVLTSAVMLLFYIKNHIDTHGKELGILKALGYSNRKVAKHFWVFGASVFIGCTLGVLLAFGYMPSFYKAQNAEGLFPEFTAQLHPALIGLLIGAPTLCFMLLSIGFAWFKLHLPALDLLKEKQESRIRIRKTGSQPADFLTDLRKNTLKGKKILVFFIAFSAFCFSAMTQMSFSMNELSSETFAFMVITIGLVLAFMTLFLSLTTVLKANTKTIAMMRTFGYRYNECSKAILGGYRPVAYIGFAVGTAYQYLLLKIVVSTVFSEVQNVPEFHFSFWALAVSLVTFVIAYELILYCYSLRIKKLSLKSIMLE